MKKKVAIIITFFIIICITNICYAKYVIEYTTIAAKIDIDRNPPQIEVISIINTNTNYENYANNTYTMTIQVKVTEENIKINNFNENNIVVFIGESKINSENMQIIKISEQTGKIIYNILLKNLEENGNLKLKVNKSTIIDKSNNINEEKIFESNIEIDNIKQR